MSKQKGNRTRRKAIEQLKEWGYLVDTVEKTSKFAKYKDLFAEHCDGFDLIAINREHTLLVQVKTNKPAKQKTYKEFAKQYAHKQRHIVVMTWEDRKGWIIQWYQSNGSIIKQDLRK